MSLPHSGDSSWCLKYSTASIFHVVATAEALSGHLIWWITENMKADRAVWKFWFVCAAPTSYTNDLRKKFLYYFGQKEQIFLKCYSKALAASINKANRVRWHSFTKQEWKARLCITVFWGKRIKPPGGYPFTSQLSWPSQRTDSRPPPPHSPALSSSPRLPPVRHPPLNFNTCQCFLPPRRLHTCCSSHSRMLFGVAVTAGAVLHPHTPQPRPPLQLFCVRLLQTHTATWFRNGYGGIKRMKLGILGPAAVFSHLHTRVENAWTLLPAGRQKEPNIDVVWRARLTSTSFYVTNICKSINITYRLQLLA